jgi:ATP-dependent DNA helicase PIF1
VIELTLKLGAQVMLLKNLSQEEGLVNGSRGVVTGFSLSGKPIVRFRNGTIKTIKEESWKSDTEPPVERIQIPLRLAYAITIHKSQGSTLDCALIDVGPNIFEYGQAYVALSRAKSLDSLYIKAVTASAFRANPVVLAFYEGREYPIGVTAPPPLQDDAYNITDDIPDLSITQEECKQVLNVKGSDIRSFFQMHR